MKVKTAIEVEIINSNECIDIMHDLLARRLGEKEEVLQEADREGEYTKITPLVDRE
jgi:hypothetical protein